MTIPINDDFANAVDLGNVSNIVFQIDNTDAGFETDEPDILGISGNRSIWYKWTCPTTGAVEIRTSNTWFDLSALDSVLGVYTGGVLASLTKIAEDDNSAFAATLMITPDVPENYRYSSRVQFNGVQGQEYKILIDSKSYNEPFRDRVLGRASFAGRTNVSIQASETIANDNFANAKELGQERRIVYSQISVGATTEAGEPSKSGDVGGASVWFKWTAPLNSHVRIYCDTNSFESLLSVYTGTVLTALTLIAEDDTENDPGVFFAATAGTQYKIVVDGKSGACGSLMLRIEQNTPSPDEGWDF